MTRRIAFTLRLAAAYAVMATFWILLPDRDAPKVDIDTTATATRLSRLAYKDWLFIAANAGLLAAVLRREWNVSDRLVGDLRAAQDKLEKWLTDTADVAVFGLDRDGRLTSWNRSAEHVLGWRAGEILGSEFGRIVAPSASQTHPMSRVLAEAQQNREVRIEIELTGKDGRVFPARLHLVHEPASSGSGREFICIARAKAGSFQPEPGLSDGEPWFRAIFEHAAIGIAQVATDGRMLRANPHFCSLVGRTEQDLQNSTFADFTYPDDIGPDVHLVSRCLAGEIDRFSMEKRYVRPDGSLLWATLFVALVRDAQNRPMYFISVINDISWRKAAEEALADSRQRLQSAVEIARVGFWEYNLDTKAMYYSREAVAQLGFKIGEISDSPDEYRSRVHPDDRARIESLRQVVLSGRQEAAEGEFRFQHRDGTYRDLHVRTAVLRNAEGHPTRLLGANIDLTPMRESERLVHRLSARILRLQDTERRRIARQLHDTTAQNLAALNMNLARLRRMAARLDAKPEPTIDECISLTDLCVQEVRTLAYLLHPPLLDDFGLERAVVDYVHGFSERSGLEVTVSVEGQIGRLSDEVELSLFRILQESLTNVMRHSACTEASVQLSRIGDAIALEVIDNGRGITPSNLERLRAGAPLGVGVTGMRERIEQIGGRLDISSSPGGTTVRAVVSVENSG